MQTNRSKLARLALALAIVIAAASSVAPAFAKHGADDGPNHNAGDVRGEGAGHP